MSFLRNEARLICDLGFEPITTGGADSFEVSHTRMWRSSPLLSSASMCLPSGESWTPDMAGNWASVSTLGTLIGGASAAMALVPAHRDAATIAARAFKAGRRRNVFIG